MGNRNHRYTQQQRVGKWVAHVSPSTLYGYFEHDEWGEGGGLWFGPREDRRPGIELIDFDGRSCLPIDVAVALTQLDYFVSPICCANEQRAAERMMIECKVPT